jgi:hypothetical protein
VSVPSGNRLGSFGSGILRVAPIAAVLLGYFGVMLPRVGLSNSLLILAIIAVAAQSLVVYLSKRDADDGFESMQRHLNKTRTDINDGFERMEGVIDDMGSQTTETDGGWNEGGDQRHRSEEIEIELENASGAGALSGLVAGGALGAPFGPAGVIVGGVLGGLIGNSVEYQNLKQEQQEQLRSGVAEFIEENTSRYVRLVNFRGVSEQQDSSGSYWRFEFADQQGDSHTAKLYPNDNRVVLER